MEKALERLKRNPVLFAETFLGFEPFSYQARLLLDKSKRIVSCMGRQTGKTVTVGAKAIHFAFTRPETTTLIVSPSLRQSMIMFDRVLSFVRRSTILPKSVVRQTRTVIQLSNGSQIIALPCSEYFLRGYTAHLIICDEAAFMPEEVITQIVFPMISTTEGYAIFLSTPWGRDNFFYRAFMDPDYSVHHVKSRECPIISKEFLDEMRRNMTDEAYRMEYEAEFTEAATSYFPQDLIRSCIDPTLELQHDVEALGRQEGNFCGGCDLGKLRDYSVFTVVQKGGDRLKLVFLKEFPLMTSYSHVIGFVVRADAKYHFHKILIDKSGVGEVVAEEIKNQGLGNAEGQSFTVQSKGEMLGYLKLKMQQGLFKMPYDRRLCEQINEQRFEYMASGQLKFSHPSNSHDDQLWALALSVSASRGGIPSRLVRAY